MKNLYALAVLLILSLFTQVAITQPTVPFYILFGESNCGWTNATDMTPEEITAYRKIIPQTDIWNPGRGGYSAQFEKLDVGVNTMCENYANVSQFGPEASLFAKFNEQKPSQRFLFKMGEANTSVTIDWKPLVPAQGAYGARFVQFWDWLDIAVSQVIAQGYKPDLKAIIWIAGENDAKPDHENQATGELAALKNFFPNVDYVWNQLITKYGLPKPTYKTVLGRLNGPGASFPYRDIVRKAQADYCADPANNAVLIDTDSYGLFDYAHYNTTGMIQYGKDIFKVLQSPLSNLTISSGSFTTPYADSVTNYTANVTSGNTVTVTPTAADPAAVITVNGITTPSGTASAPITLAVGSNSIAIEVNSPDGRLSSYTIKVNRSSTAPVVGTLATSSLTTTSAVLNGTVNANDITSATSFDFGPTNSLGTSIAATPASVSGTTDIPISASRASLSINTQYFYRAAATNAAGPTYGSILSFYTLANTPGAPTVNTPTQTSLSVGLSAVNSNPAATGFAIQETSTNKYIQADGTLGVNAVFRTVGDWNTIVVTGLLPATTYTFRAKARNGENVETAFGTTAAAATVATTNADLSNLTSTAGSFSPAFSSGVASYTASVANNVTAITVTATSADANAVVKVNGNTVSSGVASPSVSLTTGTNVINIVVTAQDGITSKTYTLTVTRAGASNADLSGLSTSTGSLSPVFSSGSTGYTVAVANNVSSITVTPVVADPKAKIKVNNVDVASNTASGSISLVIGSTLVNVVVLAEDGTTSKTYTITVNRAGSGNANLSALTPSSGVLSPAFAAGTTAYTLAIDNSVSGITITPTVADATATVKVNNTTVASGTASNVLPLVVGSNTITVTVQAQDGTPKNYVITATRAADTNANLSNLTTSAGAISPAFSENTTSYNASVSNSTSTITVTPTVADVDANVKVNNVAVNSGSASGPISLQVGSNIINISVLAGDGATVKSYTLTVTRAVSANSNLLNLTSTAGALNPSFSSAVTTYTASVANTVTDVTVTPTVADAGAVVRVNTVLVASGTASASIPLAVGANTISVVVTAQNGSTTTYTLTVTRAKSSNANLSGLSASAGALSPGFTQAGTNYSLSVQNNVTSTTIIPTSADPTAIIKVNNTTVASGSPSPGISLNVGTNIISVVVTAGDGTTTKTYTVTIVRAGSNVATLSSLTTTAGALTPGFNNGTFNYAVTVANNTSTTTVTPTLSDATANVQVNGTAVGNGTSSGPINLSVGTNTITVLVTSQTGTTSTYTITVTRTGAANANLSGLTVSTGTLTPGFTSATTGYALSVPNSVASLTVTPTLADPNASVKVNTNTVVSGSASNSISLSVGTTIITVAVIAQDGTTTKNYTITVSRAASTNTNLAALTTTAGLLNPVFVPGTTTYGASVANNVSTITVTPTVADANASVKVNGTAVTSGAASAALTLTVGANVISIVVTAQDGSDKTYTLTVTRAGSSNANLSALASTAGSLTPAFSSGVVSYTASVDNSVSGITVTPTAADPNATIRVNTVIVTSGTASANISLAVGQNTITIQVTAQDGSTKSYSLIVTRAASANADLQSLVTTAGAISPSFASATVNYTVTVQNSVSSITVTPTVAASGATIKVNGSTVASGSATQNITLNVGSNAISIIVVAPDGTGTKTYTLTVTRAGSSNANLSLLATTAGPINPGFASATLAYTASVINTISSITVTPTVADPTAVVRVNNVVVTSGSASAPITLAIGSNVINIVVQAQDNTTSKTYTLTVTRVGATNSKLSNLTTTAGAISPVFAANTISYAVSVDNTVTSTTVTPTLADPNAKVRVNNVLVTSGAASLPVSLVVGINNISIDVTAEDGTTVTSYSLAVTRAASSNSNLAGLSISPGTLSPSFGSGTLNYTSSVTNNVSTVTVTPISSDDTATIKVNGTTVASNTASGNIALNVGTNTINVVVTAQDGTSKTYKIVVTRAASNDANLFNLTTTAGIINPTFVSTTTSYTAAVANVVTSITVTPTANDADAVIKVNGITVTNGAASGGIALNVGQNTVTILVTADDKVTTKTYTLVVTRAQSSNANLSSLTTTAGTISPTFAAGTFNYSVSVANNISTTTVTASVADATASLKINNVVVISGTPSGTINLAVGINSIPVVVTAQNGTTSTYTLTITRAASSNANLSALTISTGSLTPVFSPSTTTYTASVSNTVSSITVTPTLDDPTATLTVNNLAATSGNGSVVTLNVGTNTINVVVTAKNNTTKTYTLTVTKAASPNAYLTSLTTTAGALSPVFAQSTFSYTASVANGVNSITVTPGFSNTATVKVNGNPVNSGSPSGNVTLAVGINTINIVVTGNDNSVNTYTLVVTRAGASNANLFSLTTTAGPLSPAFSSTELNYNASVANTVTSITVTPTLDDVKAVVKVNDAIVTSGSASNPIQLNVGVNVINVLVLAEDGTTSKTYTLTITRAGNNNTNISNLVLSSGTLTPAFVPGTLSYTAAVGNAVTAITITPTLADANATVKVNNVVVPSGTASTSISLGVGPTTITLIVTAENGVATKSYTVVVTRAASSDATMSGLTTSAGSVSPSFTSANTNYTLAVANTIAGITVTPTLTSPDASVKVNGNSAVSGSASSNIPLNVGVNTINVVVTAQNGATNTYTLTVTRAGAANANLSNLTTTAGTISPTFAAGTLAYTASVSNTVAGITVTPTLADAGATVKINDVIVPSGTASANIPLVAGTNVINIVVLAQDSTTTKNYRLTITKAGAEASITFSGKVMLQGAYNTTSGIMSNLLNTGGSLQKFALSQPYSMAPFNYQGGETVESGFFTNKPDIVDWILLELRSETNPSNILARRAAFVKRDGTIVEIDGSGTKVYFYGLVNDNYFVSIRHRNHLGVRTAAALPFTSGGAIFDFTAGTDTYRALGYPYDPCIKMISSTIPEKIVWAMRGGNANINSNVKFNGPRNDQDTIQNGLLKGSLSQVLSLQYTSEDINMDGVIKTNGPNNDQNFLLNVILIGLLSSIYNEQL